MPSWRSFRRKLLYSRQRTKGELFFLKRPQIFSVRVRNWGGRDIHGKSDLKVTLSRPQWAFRGIYVWWPASLFAVTWLNSAFFKWWRRKSLNFTFTSNVTNPGHYFLFNYIRHSLVSFISTPPGHGSMTSVHFSLTSRQPSRLSDDCCLSVIALLLRASHINKEGLGCIISTGRVLGFPRPLHDNTDKYGRHCIHAAFTRQSSRTQGNCANYVSSRSPRTTRLSLCPRRSKRTRCVQEVVHRELKLSKNPNSKGLRKKYGSYKWSGLARSLIRQRKVSHVHLYFLKQFWLLWTNNSNKHAHSLLLWQIFRGFLLVKASSANKFSFPLQSLHRP